LETIHPRATRHKYFRCLLVFWFQLNV
jgi:hypothetical protein